MQASSIGIEFTMEDLSKTLQDIRMFGNAVQGRIVRKALDRAARPIATDVRAGAPRRTGALGASIGIKHKTYRPSSTVIALIGARWSFGARGTSFAARGIRPFYYLHLVEGPVKGQTKPYRARRGPRKVPVIISHGRGPTPGVGFVAAVGAKHKSTAPAVIIKEVDEGIRNELAREFD